MSRRYLVVLVVIVVSAAVSCAATTTTEVGPVTLDAPSGWVVDDRPSTADEAILEERRWRDGDAPGRLVQVVVGCGEGDAAALREALTAAYQIRDELPATTVDIPGLDDAERVALALATDPTGATQGTFRLEGVYGAGSGGLVVVEVGMVSDDHDEDLVDDVLGSVEVDEGALATRCARPN